MVTVPFPQFEPDKNRFNNGATPTIINARPVSDGWAPLPSFQPTVPNFELLTDEDGNILSILDAGSVLIDGDGAPLDGPIQLSEECRGAIFFRATDGSSIIIAGTETKLYRFDTSSYIWVDITRASGDYNVGVKERWSFTTFGNWIYAQNGTDTKQGYELGASTLFDDVPVYDYDDPTITNAGPPVAKYTATVSNFVMEGCLYENNEAVQWSAIENPEAGVIGYDGCDQQVFPDSGGVTGIIPVSTGAVVFCRRAIHTLNFALTSEYVFTSQPINKYRGAIAPYAICSIGQDDFVWYAADGFFRSANQTPIGAERVNRWFRERTSEVSREAMVATPDYARMIVWFRYQRSDGAFETLGYKWDLDLWCLSDADMAMLFPAETPSVSIDGAAALYQSIDDISEPFDSTRWDGGAQEYAGISSNGYMCFMNGANQAVVVETNEMSLNGDSFAFVNGGRIDGDVVDFTARLDTTNYKGGAFETGNDLTPTPRTKRISFRSSGRTHKAAVSVEAGTSWSIIRGIELDVAGGGRK